MQRVARLALDWARQMGIPEAELCRWLKAVWLHDALRDADEDELAKWAPSARTPVGLSHGPAAASRAKAEGETDRGVLDAVRYHSVGLAEWDMVGRVLYCADFLEPGRTFEAEARGALAARFPSDSAGVLFEVAQWRVTNLIRSGWPLPDPTYRFWNSLARPGSAGSR
jgi:HD superfamily phosphohydrolase YqeK